MHVEIDVRSVITDHRLLLLWFRDEIRMVHYDTDRNTVRAVARGGACMTMVMMSTVG